MNQRIQLALLLAVAIGFAAIAQASDAPTTCQKRTAPKSVYAPDPEPPASWAGHAPREATTVFDVTVDKKGKVQDPTIVHSGDKDADKKALETLRHWRFKPATCDGQPVETKITVEINTSLQ